MQFIVLVLFVAVGLTSHVGVGAAKPPTLPKEFHLCQQNNDTCLLQAVREAVKFLLNGYPKLGMFPLDPLRANLLVLDTGNGPVGLKLTLKEQDMTGILNYDIQKVHGDFGASTFRLELSGFVPYVTLVGDYEVVGKVLILPIVGSGKNNLTIVNNDVKFVFTGHVENKNGDDFVLIDDVQLTFNTTRLYMRLDNLFNGDKALGDNMNRFLNDNWEDLLMHLREQVSEVLAAIVKDVANRLYSRIPYRKIHLV